MCYILVKLIRDSVECLALDREVMGVNLSLFPRAFIMKTNPLVFGRASFNGAGLVAYEDPAVVHA